MDIPKVGKVIPSNEVSSFGFYNMIYILSDGKFLNIADALIKPIDEAFMFMLYDNVRNYDSAKTLNKIHK